MEILAWILLFTQLLFSFVAGIYFFSNLKDKHSAKTGVFADSKEELEKMRKLRAIKLNKPLSELTRPESLSEIAGQAKALKALRAAICSPNPQHVIIYGPPGVGKTAAARVMLSEAIKMKQSPFTDKSPFIELDAAILQFDERSIADPLIGSVHDPIYHGGGSYSQAGVPQPKPGAVTNAHGGILFIDEIGELHSVQMNRLLKVLEDRKVFLSSSYYSKSNPNIPIHVHDIFAKGLPADFRLIGATTRKPEEIPAALRSRCREIFFEPLSKKDMLSIADNALIKTGLKFDEPVAVLIASAAGNGRDAVNIVQSAASFAMVDNREAISLPDVNEILEQQGYSCENSVKIEKCYKIGTILAPVISPGGKGSLIEIEAAAIPTVRESGKLRVTGIAEAEEVSLRGSRLMGRSTCFASVENAICAINNLCGINTSDYDLHIHFSSNALVDGPSAGCAVFCAVYSAITKIPIPSDIAITGEMSIMGKVRSVGGISEKIDIAAESGISVIYLPESNSHTSKNDLSITCISSYEDILGFVFGISGNVSENRLHLITGQSLRTEQGDS